MAMRSRWSTRRMTGASRSSIEAVEHVRVDDSIALISFATDRLRNQCALTVLRDHPQARTVPNAIVVRGDLRSSGNTVTEMRNELIRQLRLPSCIFRSDLPSLVELLNRSSLPRVIDRNSPDRLIGERSA